MVGFGFFFEAAVGIHAGFFDSGAVTHVSLVSVGLDCTELALEMRSGHLKWHWGYTRNPKLLSCQTH